MPIAIGMKYWFEVKIFKHRYLHKSLTISNNFLRLTAMVKIFKHREKGLQLKNPLSIHPLPLYFSKAVDELTTDFKQIDK